MLCQAMPAAADVAEDMARGEEAYNRQDVVDAMRWFQSAAEQGYAPAQVRLAYIYDKAEENDEAARWYRMAAEQGDPAGQLGLGQLYLIGEGVALDYEQGLMWITRAAEAGLADAMTVLALNYERGDAGRAVDYIHALEWWQRAAALGDFRAADRLYRAYKYGEIGLAVDAAQAEQWRLRREPVGEVK